MLVIDWAARNTWIAIGAFLATAIPLILFLSGDELLLTVVACLLGASAGFVAWRVAMGDGGRR